MFVNISMLFPVVKLHQQSHQQQHQQYQNQQQQQLPQLLPHFTTYNDSIGPTTEPVPPTAAPAIPEVPEVPENVPEPATEKVCPSEIKQKKR